MRILFVTLLLMACGQQEKETSGTPEPRALTETPSESPAEAKQMPELLRLDVETTWIALDKAYWVFVKPTVIANIPDSLFRYRVGIALSPTDNPPEDCENGVYSGISDRADTRIHLRGVEAGDYMLIACVIDLDNGETGATLGKGVSLVK